MRLCAVYGTRPELIKLTPLLDELARRGHAVTRWFSNQSPDLCSGPAQVEWSGLGAGVGSVLRGLDATCFDAVLVQGDTATAFAGALGAWLQRVSVIHLEAGLRTYAPLPWPEEGFRRLIAPLAALHLAPDELAATNLRGEGFDNIEVVGNTIIDALPRRPFRIVATLHRRENWGDRLLAVLQMLSRFAGKGGVDIAVISHPNWPPGVAGKTDSLVVLPPQPHATLLDLLDRASVVITDSGGLQEEAAWFERPCLVFRASSERSALVELGAVTICPTVDRLERELNSLYSRKYAYGSGDAARLAADAIEAFASTELTGT